MTWGPLLKVLRSSSCCWNFFLILNLFCCFETLKIFAFCWKLHFMLDPWGVLPVSTVSNPVWLKWLYLVVIYRLQESLNPKRLCWRQCSGFQSSFYILFPNSALVFTSTPNYRPPLSVSLRMEAAVIPSVWLVCIRQWAIRSSVFWVSLPYNHR